MSSRKETPNSMEGREISTGARILLTMRSGMAAEPIQAMLTMAGYRVIPILDGQSVIASSETHQPDLILVETRLLGADGCEVCAWLKGQRHTRSTPVVLLGEADQRQRAWEVGADEFLCLPVVRTELLARVASLLQFRGLAGDTVDIEDAFLALATTVEAKDPFTSGHLGRVVKYALALGERVGLSAEELRELRKGAILHDVGKVAVPRLVLNKPGPLTQEDWEHIKAHPDIGARICRPFGQRRLVEEVVRHHHERYDGQGYPDGLAGNEIPLLARIMAIADAYDALTSPRPYRGAFSQETSLEVLQREAGRQFDPELVALFVDMMTKGET